MPVRGACYIASKCNVIRLTWVPLCGPLLAACGLSVGGWYHDAHLMQRFFLSHSQRYNKLLCCVIGDGRHVGRPLRNDIQRIRGAVWRQVDVRAIYVQCVQQSGCIFFHGEHTASVLHISGQVSTYPIPLVALLPSGSVKHVSKTPMHVAGGTLNRTSINLASCSRNLALNTKHCALRMRND